MSTCPEKDIHSLYVDHELPVAYIPQYEEHIASCESCRTYLARLTSMHNALSADAAELTRTDSQIDRSFERLQAKLSYSRTMGSTRRSSVSEHVLKLGKSSGVVGALAGAAAAVAVMVLVPGRTGGTQAAVAEAAQGTFTPVARMLIQSPDELATTISPLLSDGSAEATQVSLGNTAMPAVSALGGNVVFVDQTDGRSGMQAARASLSSYDVLTPTVEVLTQPETTSGFRFRVTTGQGTISVEIGSEN